MFCNLNNTDIVYNSLCKQEVLYLRRLQPSTYVNVCTISICSIIFRNLPIIFPKSFTSHIFTHYFHYPAFIVLMIIMATCIIVTIKYICYRKGCSQFRHFHTLNWHADSEKKLTIIFNNLRDIFIILGYCRSQLILIQVKIL